MKEARVAGVKREGRTLPNGILDGAHAVRDAGTFAVLIEMVAADLAAQVTQEVDIPAVGIGAETGPTRRSWSGSTHVD
jgi:3-methyl-2-oxobutanoate hydroxymethyltransferase